jgi:hypothetical protein
MSWIKIKCNSNIVQGDVLSYDTSSNLYIRANNMNTPLYVARENAVEDADNLGVYYVRAQAQGQVEAKASRDIVDQGGFMAVENGAVYIDNNNITSPGIIWNNFVGTPARLAGDLVTITLR